MEIQKYEAFIKTAELENVKLAADALGYTQAGLGYILKSLEEELDTVLFLRDYGRIHLSAAGKELLPFARHICNDQRRLTEKLLELRSLESGRITVAVFTSVASRWLPFLMREFLARYPGMEIDVKWYGGKKELDELLQAGDVDCAFAVLPDANDSFVKVFLQEDPLTVILAKDHPLADAPFFPSAAMDEVPYISDGNHSEIAELLRLNGAKATPAMTLLDDLAVIAMVSQGFGYSILPSLQTEGLTDVLAVKAPQVPFSREVGLVFRSRQESSRAALAFIDFTKEWIETHKQ